MDTSLLHHMFALGLPVAEKIFRPVIVYVFLILGLRLAGKRELAQLNPFDLVVLLTLSNTVQNAIIGEDNSVTGGLIGAATLLIINHLVVKILFSNERLERLVEGECVALIENGQIKADRLEKELVTLAELETDGQRVAVESTLPFAAGATLVGTDPETQAEYRIKVRGGRRVSDAAFRIEGRFVSLTKAERERLLAALAAAEG